MAAGWLRLAEQAAKNQTADLVYEALLPRGDPPQIRQIQPQPSDQE
jgi:hypothetical protein